MSDGCGHGFINPLENCQLCMEQEIARLNSENDRLIAKLARAEDELDRVTLVMDSDLANVTNAKLREENERLRQAECGRCGRSLPPDGDCYGCESDRLLAVLKSARNVLAMNNRGIEFWQAVVGLRSAIRAYDERKQKDDT